MVASITPVSGNIADLSTALFAAGDNADDASLFAALVAAAAQGEDGSQTLAPPALLGALPGTQQTLAPSLAAWTFPLRLPAMPEMANPVSLLSDAAQIPVAKNERGFAPALTPFVFQRANLSLPPAALEAIPPMLPENSIPPIELPAATLPAPAGPSTAPSNSPPELEPPQAAAPNPLPAQIRLALANIPGSPALIVRNILFAQMPVQAQGDENAAPNPSASAQSENNTDSTPAPDVPTPQIAAPPDSSPSASIPLAPTPPERAPQAPIVLAQLPDPAPEDETKAPAPPATAQVELTPRTPESNAKTASAPAPIALSPLPEPTPGNESAAPAPSVTAQSEIAPKAASSDTKTASAPAPIATKPAGGNRKEDEVSGGSPAVTLGTLAENAIVLAMPVMAPPPALQPMASQAETLPAPAIDTNAPSNNGSVATSQPQPAPDANAAPAPSANTTLPPDAGGEEISPQTASAAVQVSNGPVARPQPTPPNFRIAGAASQRSKPAGESQPEFAPQAAANSASDAELVRPARVNPQAEATVSDPATPDSTDTAKSADASASVPNAKPAEHATVQPSPEPRSNMTAPDTTPQVAAAPLNAPVVHAASDNPPSPMPATWTAASSDPTETPVRVLSMGLAGLPDTTMFDALAIKIAAKSSQGDANFQIRLDPPELGRIEVNLNVDANGNAGASLTADKPQTLDLLQRDSGALERALKDAGLDLTGGLSFSLKSDARSGAWRDAQQGRARTLAIGAIESTGTGTLGAVLPAAYGFGANGRLDITV
jgi:flagellar hook-length control protein FliK